MVKRRPPCDHPGANALGIEVVEAEVKRVELMPRRGFKTSKERVSKISLPRVSILEKTVPSDPIPTRKNKGGRPRKKPPSA